MNASEYWKLTNKQSTFEYKRIHALLKQWQIANNVSESCVVHHRDDTEDTRKYNEEHYELWGFNEDGTFEYGKYILFMTISEHSAHHAKGRTHSDATKEKLSIMNMGENHPMYGKKHSDITRKKMSDAHKGEKNPFYGKHLSDEHRAKLSASRKNKKHTDCAKEKIRAARQARVAGLKLLYDTYKNNGGEKKWNDFQATIKCGDITFEMHPISVFTNGGK